MREKLLELMKNEGLKPSQLAEMLEINPAGISHILAGRNKPGFDFLQKILRRFPRINPDWLLLDSDKIYRDDPSITQPHAPQLTRPIDDGLFSTHQIRQSAASEQSEPATPAGQQTAFPGISREKAACVSRVVIFYDDRTFESFTPSRHE